MKTCINCGKTLSKNQTKYCCAKCQAEYTQKIYIKKWLSGEESGSMNNGQLSSRVRKHLLEIHFYRCEKCGWGEFNPFTNTVPLEIHHKDGDYENNRPENLEVLCPNCHSLTENHRGAKTKGVGRMTGYDSRASKANFCVDCGIEITSGATRCRACANKTFASREIPVERAKLKQMIRLMPFTQIGKEFGVSDNAIRKWCDKYGLPRRVSDIKKYSDKDWEEV